MDFTYKFVRAFLRNAPETKDLNSGAIRRCSRDASFQHEGKLHALTLTAESSVSIPSSETEGYTSDDVSEGVTFTVWDSRTRSSGRVYNLCEIGTVYPDLDISDDGVERLVAELLAAAHLTDEDLEMATEARREAVDSFREAMYG